MRQFAFQTSASLVVTFALIIALQSLASTPTSKADHVQGLEESAALFVGLHPSVGGQASFTTCTSDDDYRAYWRYGGDVWEKYLLSAVQLSHVANCSTANKIVVMQWEYPGLTDCDNGGPQVSFACWGANNGSWFTHSDHDDVSQSWIIFDEALYSPLALDWASRISAHEWGHAFSLADHNPSPSACTPDRIMEQPEVSGSACVLSPNQDEVCSVWTVAYGWVRNTDGDAYEVDGCDVDADNDGCSNIEENGGEPSFGGRRDPLFKWDFYDVNATKKVDGADVGLVRANWNPSGPVPPEDVIYDRSPGAEIWAPGPPNGMINAIDIGLAQNSFNHTCVPPP